MKIELTTLEFNAVLAGLRLLAEQLAQGEVFANDGKFGDILADNMQTWS